MKNSIFILMIVFTGIAGSNAQVSEMKKSDRNILDRFYVKAGAEFYSYSTEGVKVKGASNEIQLVGSIIYDYSDKLQVEFVYKYDFENSNFIQGYYYASETEYISYFYSQSNKSSIVNLKANYFLNKDKTENPVYLTAAAVFDIQHKLSTEGRRIGIIGSSSNSSYENLGSSYNRLLVGPQIGAGIFLAFGKVNVQSEVNFGMKIAPFVDRGYKEFVFSVGLSPVYKF